MQDCIFKINKESISKLISNLLSNGVKYAKPNTDIKITLEDSILNIQDCEIGIEKNQLNLIKQRYFRVNNDKNGFGIGLDIVNTICDKFNISLDISSKINKGANITLKF